MNIKIHFKVLYLNHRLPFLCGINTKTLMKTIYLQSSQKYIFHFTHIDKKITVHTTECGLTHKGVGWGQHIGERGIWFPSEGRFLPKIKKAFNLKALLPCPCLSKHENPSTFL